MRKFRRRHSDHEWAWWLVSVVFAVLLAIALYAFRMHQIEGMLQRRMERSQQQSAHILQQQRDRQAALARQQQEKDAREAQALQQQRQQAQLAQERAARKEAAWRQFFQPTPQCVQDPSIWNAPTHTYALKINLSRLTAIRCSASLRPKQLSLYI